MGTGETLLWKRIASAVFAISFFSEEEMSEEHCPVKSVGNDDVIAFDIVKMFDSFQTEAFQNVILEDMKNGKFFERLLALILKKK